MVWDKFRSFGYAIRTVGGNNVAELVNVFAQLPFEPGKPNLVLARTVKGKGVSYMEDDMRWHHRVPNDEEFSTAMAELQLAEEEWQKRHEFIEAG